MTNNYKMEQIAQRSREEGELRMKEQYEMLRKRFASPAEKAGVKLLEALEGILDIGKRDTTNPKYDCYYRDAKLVVKEIYDEIKSQRKSLKAADEESE